MIKRNLWFSLLFAFPFLTACGGPSEDVLEFYEKIQADEPSGVDLIDQAMEEGKLNKETALTYKVYSVFEDERLPEEYRATGYVDPTGLMYEVRHGFDSFSQATKDALAPFFKRPDDPESYFNVRYASEPDEQAGLIPSAYAQRPSSNIYTEFLTSANGKVKVWYPNATVNGTTSAVAKKMAQRMKGFLDNDDIFEEETNLLGGKQLVSDGTRGGDDKLDVYVAAINDGSDGVTYCEASDPPCSTYILMNINMGLNKDTLMKTTLAHEMFHSFQYAYDYDPVKDNWYGEATSVWVEDYVYPEANTEQAWLSKFLDHPHVSLFKESPPSDHHYAAYIFPYFLSQNFGDGYMKQSWEGCEGKNCLKTLDSIIDGGFKKQWREFTLWNYNKGPAQKYFDIGAFPTDVSSENGETTEMTILVLQAEQEIDSKKLDPLTAQLNQVFSSVDKEKVKKITFKDIANFTGLSDKAAIKAVVTYKNGEKEIEDWTDKRDRSFCIENPDEDFESITLIFSNADMKNSLNATNIKAIGKDNCYHVDQQDSRTAVIHFPYNNRGVAGIVNINTTIQTDTTGEPEEKAQEDQKYAYLTKWKLLNYFTQVKDSFSIPCDTSTAVYDYGWTTRAATYLEFDLGPEGLSEDGTFSVDLVYDGLAHPDGAYEEVPTVSINCANVSVGPTSMDLSNLKFRMEGIYTGRIFDMTEQGAKIEIPNSCLYHNCTMQNGSPFQDISAPVILEIKKYSR